MPDLSEAIHIW